MSPPEVDVVAVQVGAGSPQARFSSFSLSRSDSSENSNARECRPSSKPHQRVRAVGEARLLGVAYRSEKFTALSVIRGKSFGRPM